MALRRLAALGWMLLAFVGSDVAAEEPEQLFAARVLPLLKAGYDLRTSAAAFSETQRILTACGAD